MLVRGQTTDQNLWELDAQAKADDEQSGNIHENGAMICEPLILT